MQILSEGSISANKYIELCYQYLIQYPLKKNRILKLTDIYKLQQQKFYYKFVKHKLPFYFQSFSLESGSHLNHYITRNINDIPLPRVNHNFA